MKIYDENSNAWDLLIIILIDIPFGLVRNCYENSQDELKALVDKYEVSDQKQEILNEVTKRWNNCKTKDTILDPDIRFNEL